MATSSIFASFDIRDKETAEAFVNALDTSASQNDTQNRRASSIKVLSSESDIKALWAKRRARRQ